MTDTITKAELKELVEREKIRPDQMFSKEQILADPKVKEHIENLLLAEARADKLKENELIPGDDIPELTPEEKKKQDEENILIPDNEPESEENDLIPD